jgi:hypothetical protein
MTSTSIRRISESSREYSPLPTFCGSWTSRTTPTGTGSGSSPVHSCWVPFAVVSRPRWLLICSAEGLPVSCYCYLCLISCAAGKESEVDGNVFFLRSLYRSSLVHPRWCSPDRGYEPRDDVGWSIHRRVRHRATQFPRPVVPDRDR